MTAARVEAAPHERIRRGRSTGWILLAVLLLLAAVVLLGGRRYYRYVHRYSRTQFLPESVEGEVPSYYYLDWRDDLGAEGEWRKALDSEGLFHSARDRWVSGRLRREPLRIIQAGLCLHERLLDSLRQGRDPAKSDLMPVFRRQVDWLASEGAMRLPGGIVIFPEYDEFPIYHLHPPWISALTQGQAISLLVRATALTGDARYAACADSAVRAFQDPNLPLVWRQGDRIFLEEYPCDPPSHVLNGCIFAWFGLWDYARFRADPDVRRFCLEVMKSIRRAEPSYEIGDWTRYSMLKRRPTSPAYHEIHASQAEALAAILHDPFWAERATRWRRASRDPLKRSIVFLEVAADKVLERLAGPTAVRGLNLEGH